MKASVRFETRHVAPDDVAAAVRPDNTEEIDTRVEDGVVVTVVERGSTASLRSTADDYLRNLSVAAEVLGLEGQASSSGRSSSETGSSS